MIFSDTEMKELGSGTTYNTHNKTSLIRTLKYVPDILQTEEAFTVKEYTHTHTHILVAYNTTTLPLDGTHFVAVRGFTPKRYSSQERQWEELVGVALLRPIRTNRSSLTCRCQIPDSR